jgi:tetratricopeptide (TPR) repeat protein
MSDDPRAPSQDELERLEQAVSRDPSSPHLVALGEAYLGLGRPRDAVELGARGLRADPHNLDVRLMVGRALVSLHQWKQAQAELLKVVKTDKQNRDGFRLLGEVLMRRSDYDRALPVLQHAQNLDPANPAVLALLKRARAGQALDPPPPIPSPRAPRSARKPRLPQPAPGRPAPPSIDDEPTNVAPDHLMGGGLLADDADTGVMDMRGDATQKEVSPAPAQIQNRLPLQSTGTAPSPTVPQPPRREKRSSAAPPVRPKVQPRIMPAERKADAARESLKQSAAMGEDYLNNLLAGGLLDVPNVHVPAEELDFRRDKSWSPATKRAFVFLFTLLFLGTAGGVTWYVYSEKQKAADVAKRVDTATSLARSGSYQDLENALDEARAAMKRDEKSSQATATFAMVGAVHSLLYRSDPTNAEFATTGARRYIEPGSSGDRELLIAEAAIKLTRLPEMENPERELADLRVKLESALAKREDGWLRWLLGRAMQAAGNRSGALQAFRQAEETPEAPLVATIDRGDMLLDDGDLDGAREAYEKALAASANHPLAIIGLSLLRAETSTDLAQAVDDLNVHLTRVESPRVDAYENLATAYARYALQDYADFRKRLKLAIGLSEPRFWARVGMLRLRAGDIKGAADARQRIQWFGSEDEREEHPLVRVLDAELSLALGRPRAALAKIGKAEGLFGHAVRGRALFETGAYEESVAELEKALKIAEDDRELGAFHLAAKALASKGKERREALKELDEVRLGAKSKVPSYLEGFARLRLGKLDDAEYSLEKSVEDLTDDEPNRLAYRAHLALAELAFRRDKIDTAIAEINKALELNAAYLPTLALLGRIELARENWGEAVDALGQVVVAADEATADWVIELGYAEAVAQRLATTEISKKVDKDERKRLEKARADERASGRAAVVRAKEKGAEAEELARVAALYGPELLEELGLEAPKEDDKKKRRR